MHAQRLRKYGSTDLPSLGTYEERFWALVAIAGPDDCWLWKGFCHPQHGYGAAPRLHGHVVGAHRRSWELSNGPIPDGLFVCHDCPGGDNPKCVNPRHLFLGTSDDNMKDAVRKKQFNYGDDHWTRRPETRIRMPLGEAKKLAKLNDASVRLARLRHASGESAATLAPVFGVSKGVMDKAIRRVTWKHVV